MPARRPKTGRCKQPLFFTLRMREKRNGSLVGRRADIEDEEYTAVCRAKEPETNTPFGILGLKSDGGLMIWKMLFTWISCVWLTIEGGDKVDHLVLTARASRGWLSAICFHGLSDFGGCCDTRSKGSPAPAELVIVPLVRKARVRLGNHTITTQSRTLAWSLSCLSAGVM